MNWRNYYKNPLTINTLLGNLYGQRDFLSAIHELSPKRVLEVGTGSGGMAIFLSWLGMQVTSVDVDREILEQAEVANRELGGHVKFEVADGFSLPYSANQFDLAVHQGLLEHFSDEEIRRLLDQQLACCRQVLFSVPNNRYMRKDFGNERLMSQAQWEQILSPYKILVSRTYAPKRFPKPYLPKAHIQYMALIERKDE